MKAARFALLAATLAAAPRLAAAQIGPPVRFFGPVNQDGCPFCCEFTCQTTPTPAPEFDGQGRRVFRRFTSSFLLVAEAGVGTSNRQAGSEGVFSGGSVQPITNPSGRPSIQVLPDNNLGNGSARIDCRTIPLGGLKGFAGRLNFPPDADVTTGLIDMACRFELETTSLSACTRDRSGMFAFLGSGTTRQFCFPVSDVAAFPPGDTILALQFLDIIGNPGPRQEIVIRVEPHGGQQPSSTPTATPTPTPTLGSIAGHIRYYSSADRPVANALVQLNGPVPQTTPTNRTGDYRFAGLMPGNETVEPRKVGDFGALNAITALDASWVLQMVAGMRTFDANQRLACDVTADGTVSALDAARILQRQVGLLPRFAVSDLCNSDWVFKPMPGPANKQRLIQPQMGQGVCRRGAIAYEPLMGDATQQDFLGILFGDCTGNWQPSSAGAALRMLATAPAHTLRVRSARPVGSETLRLPVAVKGDDPYYALDLTITYDSDVLTPTSVRKLRAAGDAMVVSNLTRPGVVRIAAASALSMPAGVSVIAVDFTGAGAGESVTVTRALVDDVAAPVTD